MKRQKQNLPIRPVTFVSKGKTYHGNYTVDGDYLKAHYGMATKTTRFDPYSQTPEALATLLLSEMVEEQIKGS